MLSTTSRVQFISEPRTSFRAAATVKNVVLGSFDAEQILVARKWAQPSELTAEMVVPTGWALAHLPQNGELAWVPAKRVRYVSVTPPTGLAMLFLLEEADVVELDSEYSRLSIKGSTPEAWLRNVPSTIQQADSNLLPSSATAATWLQQACKQYSLAWPEEKVQGVPFRDLPILSSESASFVSEADEKYYGISSTSLSEIEHSFSDQRPASLLSDIADVDSRPWPAPLGEQFFSLEQAFPYTLEKSSTGAAVEYRSEFELLLLPAAESPYSDACLYWKWAVHPREKETIYISRQAGSIVGSSTLHLTSQQTDTLYYPPDYQQTTGEGEAQTTETVTRRSQARFSSTTPAMPGPWASVKTAAAESGQAKPESITAAEAAKQAAAARAGLSPRVTIDCRADGSSEALAGITEKLRPGINAGLRFSNAVLTFPIEEVDYSFGEAGWSIELPLTVKTNSIEFTYYGEEEEKYIKNDSFEGPGDAPEPPTPIEPPEYKPLGGGKVEWIAGRYSGAYNAPELLLKTSEQKLYASPYGGTESGSAWGSTIKEVPLAPEVVEHLLPLPYQGGLLRAEGYPQEFWVVNMGAGAEEPTVKHGRLPEGETIVTGATTGEWLMSTACVYGVSDSSTTPGELELTPLEAYPMVGTERVEQHGSYLYFIGKRQLWRWRGSMQELPESLGLARTAAGWKQVLATEDGSHCLAIDSQGAIWFGGSAPASLEGIVGAAGGSDGWYTWKNDKSHTLFIYNNHDAEPEATLSLPFTPTGAVLSLFPREDSSDEPAEGIARGLVLWGSGGAVWLRKASGEWGTVSLSTEAVQAACGSGTPYGTILCTENGAVVAPGTSKQAVLTNAVCVSAAGRVVDTLFLTKPHIVALLVSKEGKALTVSKQPAGGYTVSTLAVSGAKEALGEWWPTLYAVGEQAAWQCDSSTPLYSGAIQNYSYDSSSGYLNLCLENGDLLRWFPGGEVRTSEPAQEGTQLITQHVLPVKLTAGLFWGSAGEGWVGELPATYTLAMGQEGMKRVLLAASSKAYHSAWLTSSGELYWVSPDSSPTSNEDAMLTLKSSKLIGSGYSGIGFMSKYEPYLLCAYSEGGSYRLFSIQDSSSFFFTEPHVETSTEQYSVESGERILGIAKNMLYTNRAKYSLQSASEPLSREALVEELSALYVIPGSEPLALTKNGELVAPTAPYTPEGSETEKYERLTGLAGTLKPELCTSTSLTTTAGWYKREGYEGEARKYVAYKLKEGEASLGEPLVSAERMPLATTTGLWQYGYPEGSSEQVLYKLEQQPAAGEQPVAVLGRTPSIVATTGGLYSYHYAELKKFSSEPLKAGYSTVGTESTATAITESGKLYYLEGSRAVRASGDYSAYTTLVAPSSRLMAAYGPENQQSMRLTPAPAPFPCLMVSKAFYPLAPATGSLQAAGSASSSSYYLRAGDATNAAGVLYNFTGSGSWATQVYSSGLQADFVGSPTEALASEAILGAVLPTLSSFTAAGPVLGGEPGELITKKREEGERYLEFGYNQQGSSERAAMVLHQKPDASLELFRLHGDSSYNWTEVSALPSSTIEAYWPSNQAASSLLVSFKDGSLWEVEPQGEGVEPLYKQVWAAGTGMPRDCAVVAGQPTIALVPSGEYAMVKYGSEGAWQRVDAPLGKAFSTCKGESILGTDGLLWRYQEEEGKLKPVPTEDERFYQEPAA